MRKLFMIIFVMMQFLIIYASKNGIPEIEMVVVEGGTFTMGLDTEEAEHAYETPKLAYMIWAAMCPNGHRTGMNIIQRNPSGISMELKNQT